MRRHHRWMITLAGCSIAALAAASDALGQCEYGSGTWHVGPWQKAAGPLGTVRAVMSWDPDGAGPQPSVMVAAGGFVVAGTTIVNHIATWNGTQWSPMGSGFNSSVNALALYNGELIAAGSFTASGATTCNRVARWNGTSWQPLGSGVDGTVNALAVYNGRLYVGGLFNFAAGVPANRVANWDGSLWRAMGTAGANGGGGVSGSVNALHVFNGELIVGGHFESANGVANTRALAKWNGSAWISMGLVEDTSFGSSFFARVNCIGSWSSATTLNRSLYVGGQFTSIAGVPVTNIARFPVTISGSGPWVAVGAGIPTYVNEMLVLSQGVSSHNVTVSTNRGTNGNTWPGGLYRWASGVWNQFAPEQASCLGAYGGVVAGVNGLSLRVGSEWQAYGDGLNGNIVSMIEYGDAMAAFGNFTIADQQVVNGAALMTDTGWQPFPAPLLGGSFAIQSVDQVVEFGDDQFFALVRHFDAQNDTVSRVMRWNGISWTSVFWVESPSIWPTLSITNNTLYLTYNGVVSQWNGSFFVQVGPALPNNRAEGVIWWDGALHAWGHDLHRFNGSTWDLVGDNPSYILNRAFIQDGRLFMITSTQGPSTLVEFTGAGFVTLNPNVNYVWGTFNVGDDTFAHTTNTLLRFNEPTWDVLSPVFSGGIVGVQQQGKSLLVHGSTSLINGAVSPWFGCLVCCAADIAPPGGDGQVNVSDLLAVISSWGTCAAGSPCDADIVPQFLGDGQVNVSDLLAVISGWGACP